MKDDALQGVISLMIPFVSYLLLITWVLTRLVESSFRLRIAVRILWTFLQGLNPATNEPEHVDGKAQWSHVAILAWTGMRGGVSLAAALAIRLETSAGLFPQRNLLIFLTFCVLLATLVGQGGTLPLLIRTLGLKDDGADEREERIALAKTARLPSTESRSSLIIRLCIGRRNAICSISGGTNLLGCGTRARSTIR